MTESTKPAEFAAAAAWQPPTPTSSQLGFHSPKLPVDHLVLLPPPLIADNRTADARRRLSSSEHLSSVPHPFYPSHLLPPLELPDASLPTTTSHVHSREREGRDSASPATTAASTTTTTTTTTWEDEYARRPRRSAAVVAARNIPRQPSPFELNDSDEDEDATFSPPPRLVGTESSSASTKSQTVSGAGGRGGTSEVAGGGGASKRKVSHSLIERRRREKINDCLATLKDTVPNLKEEGERKIAKAKERGRKRGRGDDAGASSGLHKLEILQGTIEYINQLRARIDRLEAEPRHPKRRQVDSSSPEGESHPSSATPPQSARPPSLTTANSFDSSSASIVTSPDEPHQPVTAMSREEADHAASMLLYFSTSPELRPVHF
ncbi:hypothetical protein JCM11491_002884 [Sporobolomyces phaffii]